MVGCVQVAFDEARMHGCALRIDLPAGVVSRRDCGVVADFQDAAILADRHRAVLIYGGVVVHGDDVAVANEQRAFLLAVHHASSPRMIAASSGQPTASGSPTERSSNSWSRTSAQKVTSGPRRMPMRTLLPW